MTSVSEDEIISFIVQMVNKTRQEEKSLELELRVGQFTPSNKFIAGYHFNHRVVINRLIDRMSTVCEERENWANKKQYMFMRAAYPSGIRQTCIPNVQKTFSTKKVIEKLDLSSDRLYDLRISLSMEEPVNIKNNREIREMVKKRKPYSIRIIQRASFVETLPLDLEGGTFQLQFDISKVSPQAKNKLECTNQPCSYHCEIELLTPIAPSKSPEEELAQNRLIARSILARGRVLLGTHVLDEGGQSSRIQTAKVYMLNSWKAKENAM